MPGYCTVRTEPGVPTTRRRDTTAARIFLTVWLVYAAHLTSNVVRETYLAVAVGTALTVRVDPYLGLHPDLFEIPGRGAYINSNPGASFAGAVPYAIARPFIAALFALKPELGAPKPPTSYDDPRPNRTRLMNEMRARGLDVRLALAAFAIQLGLMAPAGALAAVLMYLYLRTRHALADRTAAWLALLYAFGTPVFFRSAFLNQNVLLAHVVMAAWMLLTTPAAGFAPGRTTRWAGAGALLGTGLLLDYSAAPIALVFGAWCMLEGWRSGAARGAARWVTACVAGAAAPVALLLLYQWRAFGSPWYPAQRYMPATELSVVGWNGISMPTWELLWRNMVDPAYGLLAFCPLLVLALVALLRWTRGDPQTRLEVGVAMAATMALWVFNSANQFAYLQWNTGVRYMVPAVPLLFTILVPELLRIRPAPRAAWIGLTLLISFAVSMTREEVTTAVRMLLTDGPTLPMLIVLNKTAAAYAPFLGDGIQPWGIIAVSIVAGAVVIVWWARGTHALQRKAPAPLPGHEG